MSIESLQSGDRVELSDGATAEVLKPAVNGVVPVRIIDSPFGPDGPGVEKDAEADEIFGVFTDQTMSEVRAL